MAESEPEPSPKPAKGKRAPKGKAKPRPGAGAGAGGINPLVTLIAQALQASGGPRPLQAGIRPVAGDPPETVYARAADYSELFTFTGFLGSIVGQPGHEDKEWQLMYLDVPLRNWLLVEADGIMQRSMVTDERVPGEQRDVIWVTGDAAVGIGRGSQSLEAQFLTGEFTRAADFRASPAGGTTAAATGVFCEAESIGCCRPSSR